MADISPVSFLASIGGPAALPRPFDDMQRRQQEAQQSQLGQQQIQRNAMVLSTAQREQQQAEQYQNDVTEALKTGQFAGLYAKYPEQQKQLQAAHDALDEPTRKANERDLFAVSSHIKNGSLDAAKKILRQRAEADRAAGMPADEDEQMLEALESGDPKQVKAAADMALYAILPADKRAEIFGKADKTHVITAGGALVDDFGTELYRAPTEGKTITVKNADGSESVVAIPGTGGGGPVSGGGASGSGALSVRLNNPGALRYSDANDWKGQVGQEGGFVKFATPADGERAHRITIANQIRAGYDTPLAWADHYAPASDGNDPRAYATTIAKGLGIGLGDKIPLSAVPKMAALSAQVESGGTPAPSGSGAKVLFQSQGGKPGYDILSAQEKQALNLPPGVAFQRSPDGKVEAISGQDTRTQQAQAVPASAQRSILENHSTLREVDRAISLVTARPQSFGFGTGALGDWFTQRNDPAGNPARAAIGKIGGKVIHDISGAAVTAAESPRFQPYVPVATDTPEQILNKLKQFKALLEGDQGDLTQAYGPENGYRGVKLPGQQGPVAVKSVQQAMKLAPGTLYTRPDGKVMRR